MCIAEESFDGGFKEGISINYSARVQKYEVVTKGHGQGPSSIMIYRPLNDGSNINEKPIEVRVLDFSLYLNTLFSGAKNGETYRPKLHVDGMSDFMIWLRPEQFVTASFLHGLLKDNLIKDSIVVFKEKPSEKQLNELKRLKRHRATRPCYL